MQPNDMYLPKICVNHLLVHLEINILSFPKFREISNNNCGARNNDLRVASLEVSWMPMRSVLGEVYGRTGFPQRNGG